MADSRSDQQRGARTAVVVLGGTAALQGLTMVTGILIARMLGVEGRGQVAFIMAVTQLLTMVTWGSSLPVTITTEIARRGVTARDGLRSIVRRRWWLLLPPAVVGSVIAGVAIAPSDGATLAVLLVVTFAVIVQTTVSRLLLACLQGEVGRIEVMAGLALVPQTLFAIVLVTLSIADVEVGPIGVVAVLAASMTVGVVGCWPALTRPRHEVDDELDERVLWRQTRTTFVSSVRPLDTIGLDRLLVGSLAGQAALGLYATAIAVANFCGVVGNAVAVITLPRIAQAHGDVAAQRRLAARWVGFTAAVGLSIVVVLQIIVDPLIRIAFGDAFAGAIEAARWLIVADLLLGIRKVLIAVLQGQGRGRTASWIEFLLVPLLVAGVAFSATQDTLVGIGVTMVVVAAAAVGALTWAVWRGVPPETSDR